ncbi:MAG: class I SAM-dependent methyltransferase [Syntrophothermus sp.]
MSSGCPICRNEKYIVKGKSLTNNISKSFMDKDYKVVQCTDCSAYYVNPSIDFTDKQWGMLYNNEYFGENTEWFEKQRTRELFERLSKIEKLLGKNKDIRLLDIGAGEGRTLLEGANRGWDVTGIDIVDNRRSNAKSEKIKFIKAKFLEYELPENYYDIIYIDSVLEHVLKPIDYLEKAKKILRPGGIIYVGVPNEDSLFNSIKYFSYKVTGKSEITEKIRPFDSPYHIIGFNKKSLNYSVTKTGLKVKLLENIGRKLDFMAYKPTAKGFWIGLLFMFPVELVAGTLKKDLYYCAYLTKD